MCSITILIRILISAVLGGLIGVERELHGCAAGLRTHILVCMGSTLFMITSIVVAVNYGHLGDTDPSRIAAGVVTGIGFLGAGAIIRYGASIRGLTTAASIWAVSAIGLAVGSALYGAAGITTVLTLSILILSRLEERMALKRHGKKLKIIISSVDAREEEEAIKNVIEAYGGRIKRVTCKDISDKKQLIFDLIIARTYQKDMVFEISALPDVEDVKWE